ncbi:MAG: hypothetical protein QM791_16015 [Ferruginibacter sp.]
MEKDYTRDSFERLLREKSDEFRMYPSNRVWNSIYNNFHPSRKWPSVVMSITLITSLLMVGYLNTNTKHNIPVSAAKQEQNTNITIAKSIPSQDFTVQPNNTLDRQDQERTAVNSKRVSNKTVVVDASILQAQTEQSVKSNNKMQGIGNNSVQFYTAAGNSIATGEKVNYNKSATYNNTTAESKLTEFSETTPGSINGDNAVTTNKENFQPGFALTTASVLKEMIEPHAMPAVAVIDNTKEDFINKTQSLAGNKAANDISGEANTGLTAEQKSWIEHYAAYNRPLAPKWKGKLSWEAHFTPSVIYRKLYINAHKKNELQNNFSDGMYYNDANSDVTQKPSFGFEAGAGLQYKLFKWAKVKTGIQLNYTRYSIEAYKNSHPSSTTITMIDEQQGFPYQVVRSTPYSNIYGLSPVKLHNQTVQLSIPIGIDLKITGYDNLEWYAGGSIQPTLVLGGSSYLISSDRQNYVKDNSMLRRLNMNAAFETYITYKTSSGYTWQFGPQYRMQLSSTNNKYYGIGEKLASYGFKVGISKKL